MPLGFFARVIIGALYMQPMDFSVWADGMEVLLEGHYITFQYQQKNFELRKKIEDREDRDTETDTQTENLLFSFFRCRVARSSNGKTRSQRRPSQNRRGDARGSLPRLLLLLLRVDRAIHRVYSLPESAIAIAKSGSCGGGTSSQGQLPERRTHNVQVCGCGKGDGNCRSR